MSHLNHVCVSVSQDWMHELKTHTLFGPSAAEPGQFQARHCKHAHKRRCYLSFGEKCSLWFVRVYFAQPTCDLCAFIIDRRLLSITSTCVPACENIPPPTPILSNHANIAPCGCGELITNRNNNHKHIKQIKDRLPEHFAQPFIIFKSADQAWHEPIARRNKGP